MAAPRKTAATAARKAEVNGKTATFKWRDREWEVPTDASEYSLDLMESLEEGKTMGIVRGALGPRQWRILRAMNLKNKDLEPLLDDIVAAMGFENAGE